MENKTLKQKLIECLPEEKFYSQKCENCGGYGWYSGTTAGHGCDGTEEDCARTCPIPIQTQEQCEMCGGTGLDERPDLEFNQALSDIKLHSIDKMMIKFIEIIEKMPVEVIEVNVDYRHPSLNSNGIVCIRKDLLLQLLTNKEE